ncbi:hypothetical protein CC876_25590, partial [Salmonella enterica subsp. enterica serovar Kisarawe]|nr:hypothetical protein [Salmonella enterica subsp. enterica serovar Infantis]EDI0749335.1 hypothetical protein [Salmonella enterica subsp. enterica serovar Kisarawe]EDI7936584.1 hypothetical protein [Salmonella enterica]EDK8769557.1 hypothetical protein [Salmonella enterica]EDL8671644.1 hypothetical protein [Salmonella enterica subsp. enterica serovar Infantis]
MSPGATVSVSPPLACIFQPLLTVVDRLSSCRLFTASVSFTASPTLLITLLPALIPPVVTEGPPVICSPSVLSSVSPVFTPVTSRLSASRMSTCPSFATVLIFLLLAAASSARPPR